MSPLMQQSSPSQLSPPLAAAAPGIVMPPKAMSRSYQYRKILKPMLERKRRARINKCLNELKHLIIEKAEVDPDALTKLEKADILELTVQQLQQQRREHGHAHNHAYVVGDGDVDVNECNPKQKIDMAKYWAGFQHCVLEVSHFVGNRNASVSDNFYNYILRRHMDNFQSYHHQKYQKQLTQHVWRPWQTILN